jgi:hypothetical protein
LYTLEFLEATEKARGRKRALWLALVSAMLTYVVALLLVAVDRWGEGLEKMGSELRKVENQQYMLQVPRIDERVSRLAIGGVDWSVGEDEGHVWIVVDATSRPQWVAGETNSRVVLVKRIPPTRSLE